MRTKEYQGRMLRLKYPEFLKTEREEPEWYAVGPKRRTTLLLRIDPEPALAEGFSRLIRNPYFTKTGGAKIDREGPFQTPNGIEGYERVTRLVNPLGAIETHGWLIDGKFRGDFVLNIQIITVEKDWYDGVIWEALLNSIEIVSEREKDAISLMAKPNRKPIPQIIEKRKEPLHIFPKTWNTCLT